MNLGGMMAVNLRLLFFRHRHDQVGRYRSFHVGVKLAEVQTDA